jgi:hypothetical protein
LNNVFIFAPKNDETLQGLSSSECRRITIGIKFSKKIRAFKDWQIIYSVAVNAGKTAAELSILLGVSESKTIQTIWQV